MHLWFINSWAYISFAGLMIMVFALLGFKAKAPFSELAARAAGALCGLAPIAFGIWANLR